MKHTFADGTKVELHKEKVMNCLVFGEEHTKESYQLNLTDEELNLFIGVLRVYFSDNCK